MKRILLISLLFIATLVIFFGARQVFAKRAIEQELGIPPLYVSPLETTTSLENFAPVRKSQRQSGFSQWSRSFVPDSH